MVAKAAKRAEPFTEAVAPVKMRVGGWVEGEEVEARRRGRVAWEKLKAPLLLESLVSLIEKEGLIRILEWRVRGQPFKFLHTTSITLIHHLLRQFQKRLSHKRSACIEHRSRATDIFPVFCPHLLHHRFHAFRV